MRLTITGYFISKPESLRKLNEERGDVLVIIGMDDQITQPVALNIFQRIKRFFTRNA